EQHAVPRFYVAGFAAADGLVCVLDCKRGNTFRTNPAKLATEDDCYAIYTENRRRDLSCDGVNQRCESWCAPQVQSLSAAASPTTEQWQAIWVLTANLLARSRRTRDTFSNQLDRATALVEKYLPFFIENPVPPALADLFGMEPDKLADTPKAM